MSRYHVAFLPFPAFGHINTTLPVVAELVRRGHRVTYATNGRFAPLIASTGARVLQYESWLASRQLPDTVDAEYLVHEPVRSIDEAIATVPVYEAGLAGDVPDVLVYDVSTFAAGRVLARKWRRPAIELFATFASNDDWSLTAQIGAMYADQIDRQHPALVDFFVKQDRLLREHGLDDVTLQEFNVPADEANLVFLPRRFQPAQETFDERFEFVGACIGNRADERHWQPPGNGKPVLFVSMGSCSYDYHRSFVRTCLAAFAGTRWHVIVSVGEHVDADALGAVPDNVELMRWAPQLTILEHADVFLSHAGMNSVMEAMYFATPVLAVPHTPEQRITAGRLAELGLGTYLPPAEVSPERLRAEVNALAADRRVHTAVDALSGEMRTAGGPARAADYIEARAAATFTLSAERAPIGR
jgi:MGT family glycosyltransferase